MDGQVVGQIKASGPELRLTLLKRVVPARYRHISDILAHPTHDGVALQLKEAVQNKVYGMTVCWGRCVWLFACFLADAYPPLVACFGRCH